MRDTTENESVLRRRPNEASKDSVKVKINKRSDSDLVDTSREGIGVNWIRIGFFMFFLFSYGDSSVRSVLYNSNLDCIYRTKKIEAP